MLPGSARRTHTPSSPPLMPDAVDAATGPALLCALFSARDRLFQESRDPERAFMATIKQSLEELLTADGAMCAALVDSNSGMMLGSAGAGIDMEVGAAGNTEVVRSKLKTMRSLGLNDVIDDILITLGKQYHILRPLARR
jgi:hypothetical protein